MSNSESISGGAVENIEYRDTGVILKVTPQISADRNINLILSTEISSLATNTIPGIDSPIINQNTISTELTAENNETILLGGIILKSKKTQILIRGSLY